jgi:integrase
MGFSVRLYGRPRPARTKKNGQVVRAHKDWYAVVTDEDTGKEENIRAYPNTEAAGKKLVFKKSQELHVGSYVPSADDMTFGEVAAEHLAHFEGRTVGPNADKSERSTQAQESILRIHLLPRFGHLKLTQIPALLPAWVDEMKTQSPAGTVNRRWECLCAVFRYAQKRLGFPDLLQRVNVDLPKKRTLADDEIITFEEFKALLAYLDVRPECMSKLDWLQGIVMVCLAGLMGLRVGEIAGADCEDMDLDNWRVRVERQLHPKGKITAPKYGSRRGVDMDPVTHKALADYRDFLGSWSGPLFRGMYGDRVGNGATVWRIQEIIRRAGLITDTVVRRGGQPVLTAKYSPHILRHFAGSFWISQGVPVDRVSRQLGHKSYNFTHKTYIHEIEKYEQRGRAKMQALGGAFPGMQASLPPPVEVEPMLPAIVMRDRVVRLDSPKPKIEIPADAPQWVPYALRLLQAGWSVPDTAKELGIDYCRVFHVFKEHGLPTPEQVRIGSGHQTNQGWRGCHDIDRTNTDKKSLTH